MQCVTNGKQTYELASDIQVSAFLSNGYKLVEKQEKKTKEPDLPQEDNVQDPVDDGEKVLDSDNNTELYTKTIINRMNLGDLKKLAEEKGLEIAEEETGTSLKKRLIDLLVK